MKFIDKLPEETRDEKYAEDFNDLKKRVVDALKKKDPDYAPWCTDNWNWGKQMIFLFDPIDSCLEVS